MSQSQRLNNQSLVPARCMVSERNGVWIGSFHGAMVGPVSVEQLDACVQGAQTSGSSWGVIHMEHVNQIDLSSVSKIADVQNAFRNRGARVLISGLQPEIEKFLRDHGVIRESELCKSLNDVLRVLMVNRG